MSTPKNMNVLITIKKKEKEKKENERRREGRDGGKILSKSSLSKQPESTNLMVPRQRISKKKCP